MSSDVLHVWSERGPVGAFSRDASGVVGFSYAEGNSLRLSLSLPLDGGWGDEAPLRYIEGLLPERPEGRAYMRRAVGAHSTDPFDLLDSVDTAGGLVFTRACEPPAHVPGDVVPMTDADVEAEVVRLSRASGSWWPESGHARFSLAGAQAKFTASIVGGVWFWPTATLPSTHVVKPDTTRYPDVAMVEAATMDVASLVGVDVPRHEVLGLASHPAYLVERFDRSRDGDGTIHRLHAEDLAQALGVAPDDKYDVEMRDVTRALAGAGFPDSLAYDWVRQVAFNDLIGNSDAHAKNYSLVYGEDGSVRLSPLYDSICMAHWADFRNGTLAMPVNGIYDPWEVTLSDWRAEARRDGLDQDVVEGIVLNVHDGLRRLDWSRLSCPTTVSDEMRACFGDCSRDLLRGSRRPPSASEVRSSVRSSHPQDDAPRHHAHRHAR